ncbi:MAG: hypothetical protein Kow00129_08060 [Thermoleophilia bacterium]
MRYLHLLFEDTGESVSRRIIRRRLDRCREELARSQPRPGFVTEVAFRWGFKDSSHFSRAFKQFHGLSPREFQRRVDGVVVAASGQKRIPLR